jgi:hypothetical protein
MCWEGHGKKMVMISFGGLSLDLPRETEEINEKLQSIGWSPTNIWTENIKNMIQER